MYIEHTIEFAVKFLTWVSFSHKLQVGSSPRKYPVDQEASDWLTLPLFP